jgi:hypothetical protein
MLKIPAEGITNKDVSITEFIPEITDQRWIEDALSVDFKKVTFYYPEDAKVERQFSKKRSEVVQELQCTFKEIVMGDDKLVGYALLLSVPGKTLLTLRERAIENRFKNLSRIEWIYDVEKSLFGRVSVKNPSSLDQDLGNENDSLLKRTNRSKYMSSTNKQALSLFGESIELRGMSLFARLAIANNKSWDKPNYDKGIVTKQITPYGGFNKIPKKLIAEQQREIIREAEEKDIQAKDNTKKEQQTMNMTLKSRKDLINAIQSGKTLSSICNLHLISLLLLLVLIIMSSIDYGMSHKTYKKVVKNIDTFSSSLDLESQIVMGIDNIRSLMLANTDMLEANNYENYTDLSEFKNVLADRLIQIQDIVDLTQKEIVSLAKDFELLNEITLDKRDLEIYYRTINGVSFGLYNLIEAINMMNSHVFTIGNAAKKDNMLSKQSVQDSIYFVFTDAPNAIFIRLREALDVMMDDMESYTSKSLRDYKIILIITVCVIFLLGIALIPILRSIQKTQEEILMLFFQIKRSHAKSFAKQCQQFYNSLQKKRTRQNAGSDSEGSDKDEDSEIGNDEDDYMLDQEIYNRLSIMGTRKLKKSSMKISVAIFWEVLLNVLLSAYFIANYVLLEQLLFGGFNGLNASLKSIGRLNTAHLMSYVAIREALCKSDWKIENIAAYDYSKLLIKNLTTVHNYIEDYFSLDKFKVKFYFGNFENDVDKVLDSSICDEGRNNYFTKIDNCTSFASEIGNYVQSFINT